MEGARQHHNVTLVILALAGLAYALQQTMVLPALPVLQHDLHTSTTWATWILTAFLLVSAVATPVLGRLGDQYGKERYLLVALVFLFAGCLGAGLATNVASLIAFRALQGFGGAVFPLAFAIIYDEFPRELVGAGVGMISAILGVGGGLGLVLSGVLIDQLSWRWIFFVGAAGVAVAVVLTWRFVPESPVKTPARLDLAGAVLLSGMLVALLLALTEGPTWGWLSARVLALFAVSLVLCLTWVQVELRVAEPMIDMRMLAQPTVLFTNATAVFAGFAMYGAFVLLPNLMQSRASYGFALSATGTGLYLLPGGVLGFVAGPLAGRLGDRHGSRRPLVLGLLLTGVGIVLLALLHTRPWHVSLGMVFVGLGVPFAFAAMAKLIIDVVRPTETGVATGMNTVMRTVGGVIGGQVVAAILAGDTIGRTAVPAQSAFVIAFWVSAAIAFLGAVLAARTHVREPRVSLAA